MRNTIALGAVLFVIFSAGVYTTMFSIPTPLLGDETVTDRMATWARTDSTP